MIVYKTGNILDDDADWIVNPVNTVGVMGKGLAKQFKDKYPEYFADYKRRCDNGEILIGHVDYYGGIFAGDKGIISFPTKKFWANKSKPEWIECGLNSILQDIMLHESFGTIAFPKLGCGLGGLDWVTQVKPLMEEFAEKNPDIEVRIYV